MQKPFKSSIAHLCGTAIFGFTYQSIGLIFSHQGPEQVPITIGKDLLWKGVTSSFRTLNVMTDLEVGVSILRQVRTIAVRCLVERSNFEPCFCDSLGVHALCQVFIGAEHVCQELVTINSKWRLDAGARR